MIDAHVRDSARRPSLLWRAVAFGCWVAFIWCHSLVQGPESSAESALVVSLLRPLFEALGVLDVEVMTLVVRKGAHFGEYAVLGVLAVGLFHALWTERDLPSLPSALLVALVPVVDECVQLAVPGRSGQATDVLIDLAGLVAGALLALVVVRARSSRVSHV